MATFTDDFDQADGDLDGQGGWQVLAETGTDAGIEVFKRYATNSSGAAAAAAYQSGTGAVLATTTSQQIAAMVTSLVEHAGAKVSLGVGGALSDDQGDPVVFGDRTLGIRASLQWAPDGERVLRIEWGYEGSLKTLAILTLVAQGSVPQSFANGHLIGDGALGAMQHLRLVVTPVDGGLRCAAYLNQPNDELPTLQALLRSDWVPSPSHAFGHWFFEFAESGTARALVVSELAASDYAMVDRRDTRLRFDGPTVAELKRSAELMLQGLNHSTDDAVWIEYAGQTIDEILTRLGDLALFAQRTESSSALDGFGPDDLWVAVLPPYANRLIEIRDAFDEQIGWEGLTDATDGSRRIRLLSTAGPFALTFALRGLRPSRMDDAIAVPREHAECVAAGIGLRIAAGERGREFTARLEGRFEAGIRRLQLDMGRLLNQRLRRASKSQQPGGIGSWGY
jgi:hypothetical protein